MQKSSDYPRKNEHSEPFFSHRVYADRKGRLGRMNSMVNKVGIWDRLPIPIGSRIADVGFGGEAEMLALSKIVGETGFVLGIESSKKTVENLATRLVNVKNVRLILGDACRIPVPEDSVEVVLFKGVLHEVREIEQALSEGKRICRNRGTILITDFSPFPRNWLRRSNPKWQVRHPWKILEPSLDVWPGFSREGVRSLIEKVELRMDRYEPDFAAGQFLRTFNSNVLSGGNSAQIDDRSLSVPPCNGS